MVKLWRKPIPRKMVAPNGALYTFYKDENGHGYITIHDDHAHLTTETYVRMQIFFNRLKEVQS